MAYSNPKNIKDIYPATILKPGTIIWRSVKFEVIKNGVSCFFDCADDIFNYKTINGLPFCLTGRISNKHDFIFEPTVGSATVEDDESYSFELSLTSDVKIPCGWTHIIIDGISAVCENVTFGGFHKRNNTKIRVNGHFGTPIDNSKYFAWRKKIFTSYLEYLYNKDIDEISATYTSIPLPLSDVEIANKNISRSFFRFGKVFHHETFGLDFNQEKNEPFDENDEFDLKNPLDAEKDLKDFMTGLANENDQEQEETKALDLIKQLQEQVNVDGEKPPEEDIEA